MITNINQERLQESKGPTTRMEKKKKKKKTRVVQDAKGSRSPSSSAPSSLTQDELSSSRFSNDSSSKPQSYHMEDFECLYQNEEDVWFQDVSIGNNNDPSMPRLAKLISPGSQRIKKGVPVVQSNLSNVKNCDSTSNRNAPARNSRNEGDPTFNPFDVFKQIDEEQANIEGFGNIRLPRSPEANQGSNKDDNSHQIHQEGFSSKERVTNGHAFSPTYHNSDEDPYLMELISENGRTKAKTSPDLLIQQTHYAAVPQNMAGASKQVTRIPPNPSSEMAHHEIQRQYPHNQSIDDDSDLEKAARNKFSSFPVHAVGSMDQTYLFPGTMRQSFVSEQFSNECMTTDKLVVVQATPVIDDDYPIVIMKDDIVYVDSSPLTLQTVLKNNKSIRRCFILSIIVVIVITIIVTVIILKGAKNEFIEQPNTGDASDWDHTTAPSSAPTFISEEVLNAAADVSGWSSVDKLGSPQFRAVGWMSSIDKISIEKFGPWFLQRYSLVVFYFSTGGTFWINQEDWLNPTLHECDWSEGIQCTMNDSEMRVVTGIDATRNGLSGTLPDELKLFTDLEFLHIPKNSISGDIPNAIGELVKISSLDLSLNKFSGSIPQVIGNAGSIVLLDISHNDITGTIPKDLYTLTLLETLDISWNAISGPIIDDMENLDKLAVFDIRHNNLYGTLPKALTILTALDYILLDDNAFTGTLPKLSMAMARRLEISLSHNLLTGTLPLERFERYLQNESPESPFRIKTLDISFNLLTGTVNTIAPLIPSLTYFDLSHNRLQGQFPGDGWSIIEYLAAGNNIFNGTLPVEWPDTLLYLDFGHNFLTKGISDRICQLQDLIFLKLDNNLELNGTVPACIFEIPSLHGLILSNSNLLGFLPTQIGLLSNLETFDGSYNTWIGTLPTELGNCSRLNTFNVSNSQLTGSIPSEIGRLRLLKSLDLRNNRIAGIIPEQLKSLTDLHYLGLAGNGINGSIPPYLCLIERNWSRIDVGCNINCSCCSGDLSLDC